MKGTPQLLLSLLVVVITGVKTQDNNQPSCLRDLYKENSKSGCADVDAWISCLQKTIQDTNTAENYDPGQVMQWEAALNYYKQRKAEEKPCPVLEKKGSCVQKETKLCYNHSSRLREYNCNSGLAVLGCLTDLNATCSTSKLVSEIVKIKGAVTDEHCSHVCVKDAVAVCKGESIIRTPTSTKAYCDTFPIILNCLTELNGTCSYPLVVSEIQFSETEKERCHSGDLKEKMENEKCYAEVYNCTLEFRKASFNKDYEKAKEEVRPAIKCLDNVTCDNDDGVKVKLVKELEDFFRIGTGI